MFFTVFMITLYRTKVTMGKHNVGSILKAPPPSSLHPFGWPHLAWGSLHMHCSPGSALKPFSLSFPRISMQPFLNTGAVYCLDRAEQTEVLSVSDKS